MKKQFFWLAMGAVSLVGCTESDLIDESSVQGNAIGFDNVIRKTTRAEVSGDLEQEGFDMFAVYCYYTKNDGDGVEMTPVKLFDGDEVTKKVKDGSTVWEYEKTRYWIPGATYNFYAYSCADIALQNKDKGIVSFDPTADGQSKLDARGLKINSYICDASHQHDLIVATAEQIIGKTSGNTKVKFSFKHALCKVSAEFVNDFPTGYTISVSDVKLRNFYNRANLSVRALKDQVTVPENATDDDMKKLQSDIWSGQARIAVADEDPSVEELTEIAMTVNNNVTDQVFLLPVYYDNDNLMIEFTITVAQGNDVFLTRTLRGTWKPAWVAGRAYKYNIHITGENAQLEPIVFETSQDITGTESWGANINTKISFSEI